MPGSSAAPALEPAALLFVVWALIFYAARIWLKHAKSDTWGADGTVVTLALMTSIAHVICICNAVHLGYGYGWKDRLDNTGISAVEKSLYAAQLLFVASEGLTRAATALFAGRILVQDEEHKKLTLGMIVACGLVSLGLLLVIAIRKPFLQPWTSIDGSEGMFVRWSIVEAVALALDVAVVALSIGVIWPLQMSVFNRLTVSSLFGVRLLIIPIVASRLWQLRPSSYGGHPDYKNVVAILTEGELQLYLILALATCLKSLFQPFHPGFFTATDSQYAIKTYGPMRPGAICDSDAYYELNGGGSRTNHSGKDDSTTTRGQLKDDDDSDQVDLLQRQLYTKPPVRTDAWATADRTSAVTKGNQIETTRTFAVDYERCDPSEF